MSKLNWMDCPQNGSGCADQALLTKMDNFEIRRNDRILIG